MSNQDFVHLHVHTDFSLLESAIQIPALAKRLTELEMKACAITDSGNLYGVMSFYYNMKKHGIHPLLGYEAFLTTGDRRDRQAAVPAGERPFYPLVLLAETAAGYFNLVRLASKAFTEGLHHKPRIDFELLAAHSNGLIALSAGGAGLPAHFLKQEQFERAVDSVGRLKEIFGADNFFLEIQDDATTETRALARSLIELSEKTGVAAVAANEARYLTADDARAHEILLCIGAGKTVADAERGTEAAAPPHERRSDAPAFYLRSPAEMWQIFGAELPSALTRTVEIAERCRVELPSGDDHNLPRYPIPPEAGCETINDYFEKVAFEGFEKRRQTVWEKALAAGTQRYELEIYRERLRTEIEIIKNMGFPGYFLIVWDFVRYAKENQIPVGPGRGSAAGSLVAYCLDITDVDPIQYDLLFERFLNPERISMPDIDIDFCVDGREKVIHHVVRRYGRDSVCQIITFGTMASRAVVKDVGRALSMPYPEVEKIAKLIPPPVRGRNVSISQAIEQVEELRVAIETDGQVRELIDLARRLEGCVRHTSVHAAGVVISPQPLEELIPISVSVKDELTTQFAMSDLEKTGMLKMDFLALTTLTIINECLLSIKQKTGTEIDWSLIPLNDPGAMSIFGEGRTEAIFQFESPGMQEICRRLKPQNIEDLAALNALYRPGPLDGGMVDDFIARHKGRKPIRYHVPQMREILNNTYGIIVYQEQIMQLAQKLAGYSLGEADMMRRAMGKKKREEMARHQEKFVQGAVERNIKPEKAEQIFSLMAQFADYGFNRSHSVAYAYLAFQTAYLKAHFPTYFYAAVLSHEAQDAAKVNKYVAELRAADTVLLPPDVNESDAGFTPVNQAIRFGLSAIKGLGEAAVNEIIRARGERPFASFFDFTTRLLTEASINKRTLHALCCAGAFDSLNAQGAAPHQYRSYLIEQIEPTLAQGQKLRAARHNGQSGLFADAPPSTAVFDCRASPSKWTEKEMWTAEKETIGFYLSSHPLEKHSDLLAELQVLPINLLDDQPREEKLWLAGIVAAAQVRLSKKGAKFSTFKLEDLTGGIKCLAWSEAYQKYASLLRDDEIIVVSGNFEASEDSAPSFIIEEVFPILEVKPGRAASLVISLPAQICDDSYCENLLALLNRQRGRCEVQFEIRLGEKYLVRLNAHASLLTRGHLALENELLEKGCRIQWRSSPASPPRRSEAATALLAKNVGDD